MDQIDAKAKVDSHLKLYERQMAHYENTQGIEWKISIGVWTLLAAAIYWAAQNAAAPKPFAVESCLVVVVFLFPLLHAVWLWRIHESEEFDKRLWSRYRTAARAILLSPDHVPEDEKESKRDVWDKLAWIVMESGVTLLMAFALRSFLW